MTRQTLVDAIHACGHERCISLTTDEVNAILDAVLPLLRAEQAELVAGAYLDAACECDKKDNFPAEIQRRILARTPANAKAALERRDAELREIDLAVWRSRESEGYRQALLSKVAERDATIERLQAELADAKRDVLLKVNRLAEADMMNGNPITGAHHRAIEKVIAAIDAAKGGSQP